MIYLISINTLLNLNWDKEPDEIKEEETIQKIEALEKNPNSMNVIKVAYDKHHRDRIMESLREIKLNQ